MNASHSINERTRCATRELVVTRALIAMLALSMSFVATHLPAQSGSYSSLAHDPLSQSTVSTNELLTPRKALHATQRARDYLIAGRVDQAQKEISRALDISPHFALALGIQGTIHLETRHFENAYNTFHAAIQADPSLGSAYLGLGMSLIAQDRFEEALQPLDRAARLLPSEWLIYFEAALTHLELGDIHAALQQLSYAENFTRMNPERISGTDYLRGLVYIDVRDPDRAKKYLEEAVTCDPNGFYAALALKRLERFRQLSMIVK